jgi:hypothetical protein
MAIAGGDVRLNLLQEIRGDLRNIEREVGELRLRATPASGGL